MTSEVIEDEKQFYSKAKTYWKEVPPTVDGMLGGYGHISTIDISSSRKFLQRFLRVGGSGMLSRRRGCVLAPPLPVTCPCRPLGLEGYRVACRLCIKVNRQELGGPGYHD